jgi:hypothetical protein
MNINGVRGDVNLSNVNMDAQSSLNATCYQSTQNDTELRNDIAQSLKNETEATLSGLNVLQASVSTATNDAINRIANTINITNVKDCVIRSVQTQQVNIGNVGGNVIIANFDMSLVSKTIANCVQSEVNNNAAVSDLKTTIDSATKATATGINPGVMLALIIGGIVIGVGLIVFIAYKIVSTVINSDATKSFVDQGGIQDVVKMATNKGPGGGGMPIPGMR